MIFQPTLASEGSWAQEDYMTIWNLIFLMFLSYWFVITLPPRKDKESTQMHNKPI